MIDISTLAQAALPAGPIGPVALAPAPAGAAERFAALMASGPADATAVAAMDRPPAALSPVAGTIATTYPRGPDGLGDQLLQGLQRVQDGFNGHVTAVGRMLEPGAPALGVPELLRLQLGMAQLAVQVEVVGKAIGRSTQNIDQLVRMQ